MFDSVSVAKLVAVSVRVAVAVAVAVAVDMGVVATVVVRWLWNEATLEKAEATKAIERTTPPIIPGEGEKKKEEEGAMISVPFVRNQSNYNQWTMILLRSNAIRL